jgi:ATP/maltotriose-dependent transcriptional regulator MalT
MRPELTGPPDLSQAFYHLLHGCTLLNRGDMDAANREADRALAIARECGQIVLVIAALCTSFAIIAAARGDWALMDSASTEGVDEGKHGHISRNWRLHFLFFQARARWHSGNLAGLRASYEDAMTPNPVEAPAAAPYRTMIRAMVQIAERAYGQAEQTLLEAIELEDAYTVTKAIGSARVMMAYLYMLRGRTSEAMDLFVPHMAVMERLDLPGQLMRESPMILPLLRHAHEKNLHRTFAERVLMMLGAPLNLVEAGGGEALSDREMEVLRVMAEGVGNREIGERLFVSEATVKTHVQRILRKLDAATRTQAVARARELMLL